MAKIYLLMDEEDFVCHVSRNKETLEKILEAMKSRKSEDDPRNYEYWKIKEWEEIVDEYVDNMPEKPLWHIRHVVGRKDPESVRQMDYASEKRCVESGRVPVYDEFPNNLITHVYVRADNREEAIEAADAEFHAYLQRELRNANKSEEE